MTGTQKIVMWIPVMLLVIGVVTWLAFRKTIRTRLRMKKHLAIENKDDEFLVAFTWSHKVLYLPTIFVSLVAYVLMLLQEGGQWTWLDPKMLGGIWIGVFFVNVLIDEYEMSLRVLTMTVLSLVALFLWLSLLNWVDGFLEFFGNLAFNIHSTGYLLLATMFAAAIAVSWIRGLFYYVVITPNYMNIQSGLTETGEQIAREDYSTRIDTADFLERMFTFGRVIITFRDHSRQPMVLLVRRIGKVAAKIEAIRGTLVVDAH